ncbi:hypothetical protein [Streptomyces sp. NPDC050485]|uniref:hypothetical protein n=1 Tax=Streptomyces sp. NPDC050485 TaxID=3365617 RepID=UPI0037894BBC
MTRAMARRNAALPGREVVSEHAHPDAVFSLDRLAGLCVELVDAVAALGGAVDRQWVSEHLHALRPHDDEVANLVAYRQPMWLLTNWMMGIGSLTPPGEAALRAVGWVERHAGAAAADLVVAYADVAGHPDAPGGSLILDQDRTDHIPAWLMLLAGVTATRGEPSAAWLRSLDPPEPDASTLAWLEGRTASEAETPRPSWPPDPRLLPDIRRKQIAFATEPATRRLTANFLEDGSLALSPDVGSWDVASSILCDQQADRLTQSWLYFVDTDMCTVAVKKAMRARSTPLAAHRVPAPYGLLVFAEPIPLRLPRTPAPRSRGSRSAPQLTPSSIRDLVAVSWGRWSPDSPNTGWNKFDEKTQSRLPITFPSGEHWWLTLYHQAMDDGYWGDAPAPPLESSDEFVLTAGRVFDQAPDCEPEYGARLLIACWDLITQEAVGKPVTESRTLPRKPTKVRADRRRGITDDGTVRLVTILGRRVAEQAQPGDASAHAAVHYKHRWTVQEHSRSHCMNPRVHSDGQCTHEDITIMEFVKGPAGAPLLRQDIVRLLQQRERER